MGRAGKGPHALLNLTILGLMETQAEATTDSESMEDMPRKIWLNFLCIRFFMTLK